MIDRKDIAAQRQGGQPEPERMVTPQEEAGMDLAELENPPQAEGPRDRSAGGGEEEPLWKDRRRNEGAD